MYEALVEKAALHLKQILDDALCMQEEEHIVVIYDEDSALSRILSAGYKKAYPQAEMVDFHAHTPEEIIAKVHSLKPKDAVLLVQSKSFRLNEFRFRIELFQRQLKTIEHLHLDRMSEDQYEIYVDALAYDKEYYHTTGHGLKKIMDTAEQTIVYCHGGTTLVYDGPMEESKLNIGDYSGMNNVGGTYPIGEVFTEPKDLSKVNGEAMVFAFADTQHIVHLYKPFKVAIEEGVLTAGEDAPEAFHELLALIREDEEVTVREFGLSLNPAMSATRMVSDITAFERMRGLHVSLGAKHTIYAKPGFHKKKSRYHIDIFFDVSSITVNGKEIFNGKEYVGLA